MAIPYFSWSETKTPPQGASLYSLTFVASMAVSLIVYMQGAIVNPDGLLYLEVAKRFIEDGAAAAFEVYDWPFYGIFIGLVHGITALSYEHSAYLLNSISVSAACAVFVAIYSEIGTHKARPWLAALLILALPVLNDYRDLIVRDFAFWAFCLLALLLFIRFLRKGTLGMSLAWQLAAIVAVLFRIEGIIFFAAPTLWFLFGPATVSARLHKILQSSFLFFGLGIAGVLGAAAFQLLWADKRAYTLELWLSYMSPSSVFAQLQAEAVNLQAQLQHLSDIGEATLVLVSGLVFLGAFKIVSNAIVPYLAIAAYGWKKRWIDSGNRSRPVLLFLLLSLLPLLAVLLSKQFLSSRHTVLTVLLLSLLTFQYVDAAFQKLADLEKRRWLAAAWAFVLVLFLDGVISSGSSKAIMKTEALWALENVDQNTTWLCNEPRLQFYTGGSCTYVDSALLLIRLKEEQETLAPGHLLLWIGRRDHELRKSIENNPSLIPVHSRMNRKGDRMAIFELPAR